MMAENSVGLVFSLVVASLAIAGFAYIGDVALEYESHALVAPNQLIGSKNAVGSLMGLGFAMSLAWMTLLVVSLGHTATALSKLFWFSMLTLLSVAVGGTITGLSIYMFHMENAVGECRALADLRKESAGVCGTFAPTAYLAIVAFFVVPIAIYTRRYVSYSNACGHTIPFHHATLEELANRAEARTLDNEAGAGFLGVPTLKRVNTTSSTSSVSSKGSIFKSSIFKGML